MAKRKLFTEVAMTLPVKQTRKRESNDKFEVSQYPTSTVVQIGKIGGINSNFDFAAFYGKGFDAIAVACQRQVERFVAGEDKVLSTASIYGYCVNGLRRFFCYLRVRSTAEQRTFTLADIDRDLTDGFLVWLKETNDDRIMQRDAYNSFKAIFIPLGRRCIFPLIEEGIGQTFPKNPVPLTSRKIRGEKPLPKDQRQIVAKALRDAVVPLFLPDAVLNGYLLTAVIFLIALHTGRNTTPLLELNVDCLHPHPKAGHWYLVLYKRRGYSSHKIVLREAQVNDGATQIKGSYAVRTNLVRLIDRVKELSAPLRTEAPNEIKDRLWIYRAVRSSGNATTRIGDIIALTRPRLDCSKRKLVEQYGLVDAENNPIDLNISRLRKTFVNRIYEILDGDIAATAIAAGHANARTTDAGYLRPGENAQKNWKFMGQILVQELLEGTNVELTPVASCNDIQNGQFAPKRDGQPCMNFLNCLCCRNMVVTGDDLYKLFSFYFRMLMERDRMDSRKWKKRYGHIPRLIDRDIIAAGLKQRKFTVEAVEASRLKAQKKPHPFWSTEGLIRDLETFT